MQFYIDYIYNIDLAKSVHDRPRAGGIGGAYILVDVFNNFKLAFVQPDLGGLHKTIRL